MLKIIAVAVAVVGLAGAAHAQSELVTNGSFEAGLDSWNSTGPCDFSVRSSGSTYGVPAPSGPADGASYVSVAPSSSYAACVLYQDVAIPAASTAQLSFAASAGFSNDANTAEYSGGFEVRSLADAVLETPFQRDGSQASAPLLANYSADLSAYAGQTVRLAIVFSNGVQCCNETFADNVSVLASTPAAAAPVPTMSEWAMILLGVALAGGAALMIQRRRTA